MVHMTPIPAGERRKDEPTTHSEGGKRSPEDFFKRVGAGKIVRGKRECLRSRESYNCRKGRKSDIHLKRHCQGKKNRKNHASKKKKGRKVGGGMKGAFSGREGGSYPEITEAKEEEKQPRSRRKGNVI